MVQQLQDDRAHTKPTTGSSESPIQDGGAAAEEKEQDDGVTLPK